MSIYLEEHGYALTATAEEIDHTFRKVAGKSMSEDYFVIWLQARVEPPIRAAT